MPSTMTIRTAADLGAAIAEARGRRELTQEQLARAVAMDRSYLAKLESGKSVLLLERSLRLLRRLGAEVTVTIPDPADNGSTTDATSRRARQD